MYTIGLRRSQYAILGLLSCGALLTLSCGHLDAQTDTWPFRPARDDFRSDALLDLRILNEKVAGESGFIRTSPEGDFLLGNGKPVRFWAVNTSVGREKPFVVRPLGRQMEPDLARHARFLAKRGVNMIRLHAHVNPDTKTNPGVALTDINAAERDWIWRSVAAMKREGIYSTVSPYWGVQASLGKSWMIPGGHEQSALGLLFFDEKLQAGYKAWMKELLATKNPYTGIPLAQDPALAIIQIQNEDSLLFWTFGNIKGEQKDRLGRKFGSWVLKKYGSGPQAMSAWQGARLPGDKGDLLDFYGVWEMTQTRTGGMAKRLADQTQFLAETMHQFNRTIGDYLRNDLGCKQIVNAGNWRTADGAKLFDSERWSYTANEVMAVNRYFTGIHKGPNEGWAISNGDQFTSISALLEPKLLPINVKWVKGYPMMVTESAWVFPNGYAAEAPFLISAYSSLTGVDTYFWFATGDDEWTQPQSANGYMPSQGKWLFANPDMLGNFPAAALMFRKGYIKKGAPIVSEERSLDDLWNRTTPIIIEEGGYDPNRDSGTIAPTSSVKQIVPQEAYLMGPVEVKYGGSASNSRIGDVKGLLDPAAKTIKSNTGELTLNFGRGNCILDSPMAQGVAAFFKNQSKFELSDVAIESSNSYGAVLIVSMDGLPIKSSKKLLVQVGTHSRPTDWKESPTSIKTEQGTVNGFKVDSYGKAPWAVAKVQLKLAIKNLGLKKATVLDMNGNAAGEISLMKLAGSARITYPENAMYVVLE